MCTISGIILIEIRGVDAEKKMGDGEDDKQQKRECNHLARRGKVENEGGVRK